MTAPPTARSLRPLLAGEAPDDHLVLSYEDRLVRRKRLLTAAGAAVLVDLAETTELAPGMVLETSVGRLIGVQAADEDLLAVRAQGPAALAQLAWHIGNRHTPCEIRDDCLVLRAEKVMAAMLLGLGATVTPMRGPFLPGGGAYGHGRVMGHSHGLDDHGHSGVDSHSHPHEH